MNDKGQVRVFVYGTLKSRHCNNLVLKESNAELLGRDSITGNFALAQIGGLPAVFDTLEDDGISTVRGEIWAGDEDMLAACDMLECHPTWYKRRKMISDRLNKRVWVYIMTDQCVTLELQWLDEGLYNPTADEKRYWAHGG